MSDSSEWNWQARYVERGLDADLAQGDIVDRDKSGLGDQLSQARWFVVLNQSCDLARQKKFENTPLLVSRARTILIAPAVPLGEYFASAIKNGRSLLKDPTFGKLLVWNHDWAVYLPPGPGLDVDLVVLLDELYMLEAWKRIDGLPDLSGYEELVRSRVLGLRSPWGERLGWMVGRQFARVGTPDPPVHLMDELKATIANRLARG